MGQDKQMTRIWIEDDLRSELKVEAAKKKRTLQDCADEALRQWLEEQRPQADKAG